MMDLPAVFAAAMAELGAFEASPRLAVGVSGGPDSTALALLAQDWARSRDGSILALIVDHALRDNSAVEATETAARLASRGIASQVLTLTNLQRGAALAERARAARFAALAEACAAVGILHLLLGHQAADQAETVAIRWLGGSGPDGLAAMAPLVETGSLRILRPLLAVSPGQLRAMLAAAGIGWVNDPSNADKAALRPRLRLLRGDRDGVGAATAALVDSAAAANRQRIRAAAATAAWLAARVTLRPEGFALLPDEAMPPAAFAGLIQTIGGAAYPPPTESVASLAQAPRAATLAGVRLLPAGRMGPGWLMLREAAAMAPPVRGRAGALWDGRFRLTASVQLPPDATLGAVGADSARLRRLSTLPAAVLCALPALRQGDALLAVPHLGYPSDAACAHANVVFSPPRPAAGAATFANGDA